MSKVCSSRILRSLASTSKVPASYHTKQNLGLALTGLHPRNASKHDSRLALSAYYSTSRPRWNASAPLAPIKSSPEVKIEEPRLSMTFTCTVPECETRSSHTFTKRAYERGIVIVQCPGCKNRHLIADNLGWFKDSTEEGKMRNVEDFMKAKGELVRRGKGHLDEDGNVVEFVD